MADSALSREQASSREKTLLTALLLSASGPLFTGLAVINSQSSTQLADFIRRGVELVALFLSWWIFRRIHRSADLSAESQARMERTVGLAVAVTMLVSGVIMLSIAASRLSTFEPGGSVTLGLTIAVLGLITNGWFWRRYRSLTREQYSAVIAAQQQLYRAKALVDLGVVVALGTVAAAPLHPLTPVIDLLGSVLVALYLLWSGFRAARAQGIFRLSARSTPGDRQA